MQDIYDVIKNIEGIYESDTSFQILKDFERVFDELDLYVYKNWEDGELLSGPDIDRHWVTCRFMWPRDKMPDPMGGKRLHDFECKIGYMKDHVIVPRKIRNPDDMRPGTKKGKLDREPIWVVEVQMPKKLIADIYTGYHDMKEFEADPAVQANINQTDSQPADLAPAAPAPVPGPDLGGTPEPTGGTV